MKKYLLLLLAASSLTQAATFNVSTTAELREAILTSATNEEDDTIILANKIYKTTDDGLGAFVYAEQSYYALTIKGGGATLSGDNTDQIFQTTSHLTMSDITFENGYIDGRGGAIQSQGSLVIDNCKFFNNTATTSGSAIYTTRSMALSNSEFKDNGTSYTIYLDSRAQISNTTFLDTNSPSIFMAWDSSLTLSNSIFTTSEAFNGYFIYNQRGRLDAFNNIFIGNTVLYSNSTSKSNFYNSIVYNEGEANFIGSSDSSISIYNSYIDNDKTFGNPIFFNLDNIFNNVNLGFSNLENNNFRLTATSDLIDAGTVSVGSITLTETDLDGRIRISGNSIDIGPYEFSSTKPIIDSVTYTGVTEEHSELTFTTDYTLADGREITEVSYDFLNDANNTTINTHTYTSAGTYTINVKVTDNEGEFSTSSLNVTITELPWSEMTYEQKLIKAISPEYYDLLISEIDIEKSESFSSGQQYVQDNLSAFSLVTEAAQATAVAASNTSGIASGKQYVQDNLSEFSLVTEAAQASAVATATNTGIADGENNVINNPVAYGLDIVVGLSKEGIAQLPTGWKMISIPEDVTDLSLFDDAKIVWFFNNETQAWTAYSSNSNTVQQLQGKDIGIITRLSAGDGVFIEM